jgi:TonB family protein
MIAAWILYALLVGILVGGGAMVLETLMRPHRLPTRWIWAGAMLLSLFWPLGHFLWKTLARAAPVGPLPDPSRVVALEPLAVQVTPESFLRALDGPIVLGWIVASALLLTLFVLLILRTQRLQKRWPGDEAGGRRVLISDDWGPAVVGFLNPQIVLPEWCRELDQDTLRLILDHEAEHMRAGDLRLLLSVGVLPLLLPWSFPLWWQLARLRLAVEGDCDLRVLKRNPHRTRPYLELLLKVGGRLPRGQALAAMLSEPEETLERRIRIMTMPFPKKPWARGVLLTCVGGALVAVACWTPGPTDVRDLEDTILPAVTEPAPEEVAHQDISATPTFTPFTVRPDIRNREEVARALEREYPPLLRGAGIGGSVQVWFFIDETGQVQRVVLNETSGHEALDEAALRVAATIAFTPALNRDRQVPVWISLPITFTASAGRDRPSAAVTGVSPQSRVEPPPAPTRVVSTEDIGAAPTFTPFTVRPDIRNRDEVARALEREYPPLLRDAGISGSVQVWFLIDETGQVRRTIVNRSSGHEALDEAALRVAAAIQFTPALNRDTPVTVWISLPITFTTR